MPSLKSILRFCAVFCVLAVVLFAPWPGLDRGYAAVFRAAGNAVFNRFWFWGDGHVRFLDLHSPALATDVDLATPGDLPRGFEPPRPSEVKDTLMVVMNRSHPGTFGQLRTSSRLLGYWPSAWLVALVLAKPMPWLRKAWALVLGVSFVGAFVAFRLSLTLVNGGFAADKPYALFTAGPLTSDLLGRAETIFVTDPTASFVVPTLIWAVVAFSWKEWAALRASLLGSENHA